MGVPRRTSKDTGARIASTVALALAIAATFAAAAGASTATSLGGGKITFQGDANNNATRVYVGTGGNFRVDNTDGKKNVPGAGCFRPQSGTQAQVACPAAGTNALEAHLGNGNDTFSNATSLASTINADGGTHIEYLNGGTGYDQINGGPAADWITDAGGNVRDAFGTQNALNGNGGNDVIRSSVGVTDDFLNGGPGSDTLEGRAGADWLLLNDGVKDMASDCGLGADAKIADANDPVTNCELSF